MPCRIVKESHAFSPFHVPDALGRWERLCARLCSARQIGIVASLRGTDQKVTLNVPVWLNVTVSWNPSWANLSLLCTSIFLTSVSLVSLPRQAPPTKRCRKLSHICRADQGAKMKPGAPAGLWARLRQASLPPAEAAAQADPWQVGAGVYLLNQAHR